MAGLLDVQIAALEAARGHHGFAYWMEMGLGKTLTALTEFKQLAETGEATRLVVVCPNTFKGGWRDEIAKHNINVDEHIYESGGQNDRFLRRSFNRPPVLIVNYEAIRRPNTQQFLIDFVGRKNGMIVFDESIQIKTHNSQQTKAAIMLSRYFKYSRILSGKPMTQGPHDLWGQMRAIGALEGRNFFSFRNTFCRMGGYLNKKVMGAQNEEILAKLIDPHVFRATKEEWLDLPPKLYTTRDVEMVGNQAAQYRQMEQDFVAWLENDEYITVDMALTKYVKLAQIQFGFIIDEEGSVHELVDPAHNPRINAIKELLDTEITGKLVVVYHHRYAGEVLLNALEDYSPTFIRGGMTPDEIVANRDSFNQNRNTRVICIQTIAGKYGHTLVGGNSVFDHCSTMAFAENTWSLDTRSQLEDRIHRIGQKGESCLYVDLVSSPLDRRIVRALQEKQAIFDAVMAHVKKSRHPQHTD